MTTGRPGLLEHGHRSRTRWGRRAVYGTIGLQEQRTQLPNPQGQQYLPRDYWQDGAANQRQQDVMYKTVLRSQMEQGPLLRQRLLLCQSLIFSFASH